MDINVKEVKIYSSERIINLDISRNNIIFPISLVPIIIMVDNNKNGVIKYVPSKKLTKDRISKRLMERLILNKEDLYKIKVQDGWKNFKYSKLVYKGKMRLYKIIQNEYNKNI